MSNMLKLKGTVICDCKMKKMLSKGEVSAVYSATTTVGNRPPIHVKILTDEDCAIHEVEVLQKLNGCVAVPQFKFHHSDQHFHYIGLTLTGETFEAIRKSSQSHQFSFKVSLKIGTQLIRIIRMLHRRDVVHGNVKTENIAVSKPQGVEKVEF